jgi:hypothetical protein
MKYSIVLFVALVSGFVGFRLGVNQPRPQSAQESSCAKARVIAKKIDANNPAGFVSVAAEAVDHQLLEPDEYAAVERRLRTNGEVVSHLASQLHNRITRSCPVYLAAPEIK